MLIDRFCKISQTSPKPRSEHEQRRAGIVSEASGQCEVFAKCERTIELSQDAETGAPRADANDGEKAGVKRAKMLNCTYSLFGGVKRRRQNQKFLPFKCSASRRGVWGEPQIKMIGNFWVLPRASKARAAEAQVSFVKILRILTEIHSNFVQYTPPKFGMSERKRVKYLKGGISIHRVILFLVSVTEQDLFRRGQ